MSAEESTGARSKRLWRSANGQPGRILKCCGAQHGGPGDSLVCRREDLVQQLEALSGGGPIAPEIRCASRKDK